MREAELKALTLAELRSRKFVRSGDPVASEFVVAGSARRADLAIMSRSFIGVEIKSEYDTLKRLNGQLNTYLSTFDQVILVVAEKHVTEVLREAPAGTEIWRFDSTGHCDVVSHGTSLEPSVHALLALLTIPALRRLTGATANASRRELLHEGSTLSRSVVEDELRSYFAERYGSTSRDFWARCKGRRIRPSHIPLLSLYAATRKAHVEARMEERVFWQNWAQQATAQMGYPVGQPG